MDELSEAIQVAWEVVYVTPPDHQAWASKLNNLAVLLGRRYLETEDIVDLDYAILVGRDALAATPKSHPNRVARLGNIQVYLSERFSKTESILDIEDAIQVGHEILQEISTHHPDRPRHLDSLASDLGDKYSRTGSVNSLEEALRLGREAVLTTPNDHPEFAMYSSNLAILLGDRYSRTGLVGDLNEAIQLSQDVIKATPAGRHERIGRLNVLSNRLDQRYRITGDTADLEKAILFAKEAMGAAPNDHPDRAILYGNLGAQLCGKYDLIGTIAELEEAIQCTRLAVKEIPNRCATRARYCSNLGSQLVRMFSRTGEMMHLQEAIRACREGVDMMPENHVKWPEVLSNLEVCLGYKYLKMGVLEDLSEAIRLAEKALEKTSKGDLDLPGRLSNLGLQLERRYVRAGDISDLDEAIRVSQEAVALVPKFHPSRGKYLDNLATQLDRRFLQAGAMSDLEDAIQNSQEAITLTQANHPDRPVRLNNLSNHLRYRYSRAGNITDLEDAIRTIQEALELTPRSHPDWAMYSNNLGDRLGFSFKENGDIAELERSIQAIRDCVGATSIADPDRALYLANLGLRLKDKYSKTLAMEDLQEAVNVAQESLQATPNEHSNRAGRLIILGDRLGDRYEITKASSDLERAISCYELALDESQCPALDRFQAGRKAARHYATLSEWEKAYKVADISISLIPNVTMRSLLNSDKQFVLRQLTGFASDAAAIAANAGMEPFTILSLLEQGRGMLATSLEELRVDLLDLQQKHPALAEQYSHLQGELEAPAASNNFKSDGFHLPMTQPQQRHEAGKKLDQLIAQIRQKPEFGDFLIPPSEVAIRSAARCGPIVVMNVSEWRCDAVLIEHDKIRLLPLASLSLNEIMDRAREHELDKPNTLSWLWDVIAKPILSTLGFTSHRYSNWSHVWWIPTGPLSKFPIHAAGHYSKGSLETVMDRVTSSYSSSIKAILNGRQRPSSPSSNQALLIPMEHTPGHFNLPYAAKEVDSLHELCKSMALEPVTTQPRKQNVLPRLLQCKVFHFAGHGYTDKDDPSRSCLLLEDAENDRLTVATLLETNLRSHPPFLAYLSACGTGRIEDERFFDESIHLISGFQLAGFRHVIGTLWEVKDDEWCVDMARITYEGMRAGVMTDESVSCGLHHAARELRNRWFNRNQDTRNGDRSQPRLELQLAGRESCAGNIVSEEDRGHGDFLRNVILSGDNDNETSKEDSFPWVPYIHFGV